MQDPKLRPPQDTPDVAKNNSGTQAGGNVAGTKGRALVGKGASGTVAAGHGAVQKKGAKY